MEGLGGEGVAHKKSTTNTHPCKGEGKEEASPSSSSSSSNISNHMGATKKQPPQTPRLPASPKKWRRSEASLSLPRPSFPTRIFCASLPKKTCADGQTWTYTELPLSKKGEKAKKRRANIGLLRLRRGKKKKVWRCFLSFPLSSIPFSLPFSSAKIFRSPFSSSSKVLKCSRRTWQQVFQKGD